LWVKKNCQFKKKKVELLRDFYGIVTTKIGSLLSVGGGKGV